MTVQRNLLLAVFAVVLLAATPAMGGDCGPDCQKPCCAGAAEEAELDLAGLSFAALDGDMFEFSEVVGTMPIALMCMMPEPEAEEAALAVQNTWSARGEEPAFGLWAISCGDPEATAEFVERLELQYPVLLDAGCTVRNTLGIEAKPAAVFFDQSGKVVKVAEMVTEETMSEGIEAASASAELFDPVCKMSVTKESAAATYEHEGKTYYFCNVGCKDAFAKDPGKYLGSE